MRVSPLEDLRKEKELARAALEEQKKLQPTRLLLINLQHRKAYDMKRHIYTVLSNRGTVTIDSKLNAVIVRDIPETLGRVQELIRRLDLPPQS